jgi:glycosyltransferase involved in cell wall biosynthesis
VTTPADGLRVLHVNDCANYAHRVLAEAVERGYEWGFYPRAEAAPGRSGILDALSYAGRGAAWLAGLALRSQRADLLHIHSGSMLHHTRFVPKRYVLTLHGTDIRTLQYDPRWQKSIREGVRRAAAVMYTTPDLRVHVTGLRPDAIYMPVPITLRALPQRSEDAAQSRRILFVSRWDGSKGAEAQLATARFLADQLPADYELVGLDWGPRSREAAAAGVTLVPRMSHETFLDYLAGCSAAIGQSSGLLGSSELEALGIGVPLYMPLMEGLYPDKPPVGWGSAVDPQGLAERLVTDLADPSALESRSDDGVRWVARHHSTAATVDSLLKVYGRAVNTEQ